MLQGFLTRSESDMAASDGKVQTQLAYPGLPTVQEQGEGIQQRNDDEVSDFGDEQVSFRISRPSIGAGMQAVDGRSELSCCSLAVAVRAWELILKDGRHVCTAINFDTDLAMHSLTFSKMAWCPKLAHSQF